MQKFRRAQAQNRIAINKHLEANVQAESSSDDDDEQNEEQMQTVVGKVLSAYQGEGADAEKILSYLINTFQSGRAVCLICISTVKKADAIWNCERCFAFLHLSCILDWIRNCLNDKREKNVALVWACPKCRTEYSQDDVPRIYKCFCKKSIDPQYQPWCIPHSCGETCSKALQPNCGHKCVLLCHPGPCPPCAKMVSVACYCNKQMPRPRRCNAKEWSCGTVCNKEYKSCPHSCKELCHAGDCPPCRETVLLECRCKRNQELRSCHEQAWSCEQPCRKLLSCNIHMCEGACHSSSDCGICPKEKNRTCPCGKKRYAISCKQDQVPTCGDTCAKLLDCGSHYCNMRCHPDRCGQCVEVVRKSCRCGSFTKEVPCGKEFHCSKKCSQMRLCGRHYCHKKCCDCLVKNTFNVCEKTCDNTLTCRKHKCAAPCHSGPCYPCARTDVIQCRCGHNKISVPCGTKKIKPPACNKPCKIPPNCHHPKRETHKCHQGPCPSCKKVCNLVYKRCGHTCVASCHAKVWVKENVNGFNAAPAGPWEIQKVTKSLKTLPCPPCEVSVQVTCLGEHETRPWPCHMAKRTSCGRECGRTLACTNHKCTIVCHRVNSPLESRNSGKGDASITSCMECEEPCSFSRPQGCTHPCAKPCHPAPCSPCKQLVRVTCHCGIGTLYKRCVELTSATKQQRDELLRCGNQCPKNYPCGHRCMNDCHSGVCENADKCNRKVKVFCACKRLKKDFICSALQKQPITVDCDDTCEKLIAEREQAKAALLEQKRKEEELRNQEELARFEKKNRKVKSRRRKDTADADSLNKNAHSYMKYWILSVLICITGFVTYSLTVQS